MSYTPLVPAIIPTSREELIETVSRLSFVREIQLDLVDGQFVPMSSWPYEPVGEPMSVRSLFEPFTLEVDLMVADPIKAAADWVVAGADMLIFHIESLPLDTFRSFTEDTFVTVGVAAHGDTSMEQLLEYAAFADYIQLMGIREIGQQGQPFDEAVLEKVQFLKSTLPEVCVAVDGSVNAATIPKLKAAGVDRFVSGSAIVKQTDFRTAYDALAALIHD